MTVPERHCPCCPCCPPPIPSPWQDLYLFLVTWCSMLQRLDLKSISFVFLFQNLSLYMSNHKRVQSDVHTAAILGSQQQTGKAHWCHQEQRAHHHGSTTKNFRTLAAGDRWVVRIAVVRCSIVTHYIGKTFCCVPTKILKANKKDKRRLHV